MAMPWYILRHFRKFFIIVVLFIEKTFFLSKKLVRNFLILVRVPFKVFASIAVLVCSRMAVDIIANLTCQAHYWTSCCPMRLKSRMKSHISRLDTKIEIGMY